MNLNEMVVLVTGAASGMGKEFALSLAKDGANVFATDLNAEGLAALEAEAADLPGDVASQTGNVAKEDDVIAMVKGCVDRFGKVTGLINNAGIFRDGLLVKKDRETGAVKRMTLDQWQAVIDVDLTGPFLCTREVAAAIIEGNFGGGVIVNISSVARHGNTGQTNYSAAKAGLVADTKLWGQELARYGIRVGAVAPGFVETPILTGMRPEVLESLLKGVPLRRAATTREIYLAVKFILECDYFTGRCIDVDGGITI